MLRRAIPDALRWLGGVRLFKAPYKRLPASVRAYVHRIAHRLPDADVSFPRLPLAPPAEVIHPPAQATLNGSGANVFAYFRGEFGLAECARLYVRALIDAGFPVALVDLDLDLPHEFSDSSFMALLGHTAPHVVNLIFVNPDYFDRALAKIGENRLEGRYTIACWFWELEHVPKTWLPALEKIDEILVASEFVADAFRRVTDKPIIRIPLPYYPVPGSGLGRRAFGLDDHAFTFLVTFDFNSFIERKNPLAALRAFQLAFPERSDVRLLIKTSNGRRQPHKLHLLLDAVGGDPRVIVRDEVLPRSHVVALMQCADAYVSLHRSEGFGLGLAECMGLGKPVIGTGWSGNLEFMNESNSILIGHHFVTVEPEQYPGGGGARWAEVDIGQAAQAMRELVQHPERARAIGSRAKQDVNERLCPARLGRELAARLEQACIQHASRVR